MLPIRRPFSVPPAERSSRGLVARGCLGAVARALTSFVQSMWGTAHGRRALRAGIEALALALAALAELTVAR